MQQVESGVPGLMKRFGAVVVGLAVPELGVKREGLKRPVQQVAASGQKQHKHQIVHVNLLGFQRTI
jgi:hypothetical protein